MKKFTSLFDKRARRGTLSAVTSIFVIAVLIVVNMLASSLNLSIDLTKERDFSITERTKQTLSEIDAAGVQDVKIYSIYREGSIMSVYTSEVNVKVTNIYMEVLKQIDAACDSVTLEFRDAVLYPTFVAPYTAEGLSIGNFDIIVEGPKRHKVISVSELILAGYDQNTGEQYPESINIESKVVNAVQYVLSDSTPKLYFSTGNGEYPPTAQLKSVLSDAIYDIKEVNLLINDMPEDCTVLILQTPETDYSAEQAERIINYLRNNGRAFVFCDYYAKDLPNFDSVLAAYGVIPENALVIEASAGNYYMYGQNLLPNIEIHVITNQLRNASAYVLTTYAVPLQISKEVKNSLKFEKLLTTSSEAYAKVGDEISSINKEQGDLSGPFNLGLAVTDSYYSGSENYTTKLVIASGSVMIDEGNPLFDSNIVFFLNSLAWMAPQTTETYYTPPKTIYSSSSLYMTFENVILTMVVTWVIIPGAIIITGVIIWLRRRNK